MKDFQLPAGSTPLNYVKDPIITLACTTLPAFMLAACLNFLYKKFQHAAYV
jgi:hypothetical protein